ncbi:MAG: aminoacyl-tRNA hydrolase [Syntrophobacterales bacterium RIFOXYC2_FULL_60_23]|jgi:PTH1 family peptidyl-tRNA hydrolase|nr:MAG: aminoacyl-tRNA hydrolase [Syntrophobacterales bacterium RIFOXYC2_FULL_60_23]
MHLIVGLGNPGRDYAWTRHNLGWQVAAHLSELWGLPLNRQSHGALWGQGRVGSEGVILAQPTTYMNLSGRAVSALMAYFKLTSEDLVVIHDDLDVPPWRLKIVERGGPGGHRGILDIMATLNTEEFLRVKLGIGRPPPGFPTEKYVLSHFPAEEAEDVAQLIERGAQAVVTLLGEGLAAAQTRFHGDPVDLKD